MDRFQAMQAFVRVADTGSFTRAADSLQVSRTRVTQWVQQLEAHLQVRLLNRSTRKLSLTADGQAYHARARQLLAELAELEGDLSSTRRSPRGRLRVDVAAPLARGLLIPALPDFLARYPDITLDLGVSDRGVDLIDQHVDCVIRGGALRDSTLQARHLADLPLGLYASPAYLARAGVPTEPQQLEQADHAWVGFAGQGLGRPTSLALSCQGTQVMVRGRQVVCVDDGNACLEAAMAGLGVVCLPAYMVADAVAQGRLQAVLGHWHCAPMPLYLAYAPNRHVSPALRAFIDWVVAQVQALPPTLAIPPGGVIG